MRLGSHSTLARPVSARLTSQEALSSAADQGVGPMQIHLECSNECWGIQQVDRDEVDVLRLELHAAWRLGSVSRHVAMTGSVITHEQCGSL